tara:strand:- start:251 stop:508 length:258 start_codon:yes stop_codon:yes gene_type:complete
MLAIHMEDFLVVQNLINWDPSLRYLTTLALNGYSEHEIAKVKITKAAKIGEVQNQGDGERSMDSHIKEETKIIFLNRPKDSQNFS